MKKILFIFILLIIFSCGESNKTAENQDNIQRLAVYEKLISDEESTKQFTEDYIKAVNSPDWKSKVPKYLQPNSEIFLEEHTAFRASFQNYKATIKHLVVDGNEAIVWLTVNATYASNYTFENSAYGDEILLGIEAKNQPLSWDETWYFDVVDGKFGIKWDFLKDNHAILKYLNADK